MGNTLLGLWEEQHYKKNERLNLKETTSQKPQTPLSPLTGGGLGVGNTLLGLWNIPPPTLIA